MSVLPESLVRNLTLPWAVGRAATDTTTFVSIRQLPPPPPLPEPTPFTLPEGDNLHQMMQTIQEDLARLRTQLEEKAAETPLHKAQLAMASINQHVKKHTAAGSSALIEQVKGFLSLPLAQQRDWSGAHAFVDVQVLVNPRS